MTVAGILILLLTGGASLLGPVWGGFLSVFPVFTVLMAAFTQAECGPDTVALLIHSSLVGQTGTIVFSFVVAECVTTLGGAVTYPLALAVLPDRQRSAAGDHAPSPRPSVQDPPA